MTQRTAECLKEAASKKGRTNIFQFETKVEALVINNLGSVNKRILQNIHHQNWQKQDYCDLLAQVFDD